MLFDLYVDARPAGRRLRRTTRPTNLVTVVAQQPDDRPPQPLQAHNLIPALNVVATARRSSKPRGWAGVVAGFDDSTPKPTMARSTEIHPPTMRDYDTSGRASKPPVTPAGTPPRVPMHGAHWLTVD